MARHLHSPVAQSAHYDPAIKCYRFKKNGVNVSCGGVHKTLEYIFYPHYKSNRSRRKSNVKVKGSTKAQGSRVDQEISDMVEGKHPKKMHPMTHKILSYFVANGERLQAAQVPVELTTDAIKLTQADVITVDSQGRLILYEIKTGAPVGFLRKQGTFQVAGFEDVPCTKKNIWQLQLAYTRMALLQAGVPIFKSFVLQIFENKEEGLKLDLQPGAAWTKRLPQNPIRKKRRKQQVKKTIAKKKKKRITPPSRSVIPKKK